MHRTNEVQQQCAQCAECTRRRLSGTASGTFDSAVKTRERVGDHAQTCVCRVASIGTCMCAHLYVCCPGRRALNAEMHATGRRGLGRPPGRRPEEVLQKAWTTTQDDAEFAQAPQAREWPAASWTLQRYADSDDAISATRGTDIGRTVMRPQVQGHVGLPQGRTIARRPTGARRMHAQPW